MPNILKEQDLRLILDSEIINVIDMYKYPDYFYLVSTKSFSFYIRELTLDSFDSKKHFHIYFYDRKLNNDPYKFFIFSSMMATSEEIELCKDIYTICEKYVSDQVKIKSDQEFQELKNKVEQGLNELRKLK